MPLFFALVGGIAAGFMQRCQKQEPVQLIVTNQHYEQQLSEILAKQDTINSVLPSMFESLRYLSERYQQSAKR